MNPEIINLANLINRTPSSVAYKLVNFASLDPSLRERGIKGAYNVSKLDSEIWNEFFNNLDTLPYKSEILLAKNRHKSIEIPNNLFETEIERTGKTREKIVKARVNQSFFRSSILASYNNTCCITGIQHHEFLIAGHIKPWSIDEKNRLNPRNGIAINALHDKAFETGLMTITTDYKIKISPLLYKQRKSKSIENYFLSLDNNDIILPSRFLPDIEFLRYHNEFKFRR